MVFRFLICYPEFFCLLKICISDRVNAYLCHISFLSLVGWFTFQPFLLWLSSWWLAERNSRSCSWLGDVKTDAVREPEERWKSSEIESVALLSFLLSLSPNQTPAHHPPFKVELLWACPLKSAQLFGQAYTVPSFVEPSL